ncbi:phage head-tail joining protein [Kluyvera genomosp. 2]|uniref:phage head-tail joining protein n=1 Tax=Kluyvera genomosp. 2 TaxID=2774054 RepID=UPI002FD80CA4
MAFTQDDVVRIERALAKGEHIVRFADRIVEYRSVQELIEARDRMLNELSKGGGRRARLVRLFHAGKGW